MSDIFFDVYILASRIRLPPVETVIRERRNLPSVDWFWKRDHRITQAARITHIHYGKYAVKLHSNHK